MHARHSLGCLIWQVGEHDPKELKERFDAMDTDKNGKVDKNEYLSWSLRDALARSTDRVVDLFKKCDSYPSST